MGDNIISVFIVVLGQWPLNPGSSMFVCFTLFNVMIIRLWAILGAEILIGKINLASQLSLQNMVPYKTNVCKKHVQWGWGGGWWSCHFYKMPSTYILSTYIHIITAIVVFRHSRQNDYTSKNNYSWSIQSFTSFLERIKIMSCLKPEFYYFMVQNIMNVCEGKRHLSELTSFYFMFFFFFLICFTILLFSTFDKFQILLEIYS